MGRVLPSFACLAVVMALSAACAGASPARETARPALPDPSPDEPTYCLVSLEGDIDQIDVNTCVKDAGPVRELVLLGTDNLNPAGCDIFLKISQAGPSFEDLSTIEAYSAYSKNLLWDGSTRGHDGTWGFEELTRMMRAEFLPGQPRFERLERERLAGRTPSKADVQALGGAGLKSRAYFKERSSHWDKRFARPGDGTWSAQFEPHAKALERWSRAAAARAARPPTLGRVEIQGDAAAKSGAFHRAQKLYAAALADASLAPADADRILEKAARLAGRMSANPPNPEEAARFAIRAEELAKADIPSAAAEMEKAVRLAPWWPEAHYNLGMMRKAAVDNAGALKSLRLYLLAAPRAADAAEVKAEIIRLEVRKEQGDKLAGLEGRWKLRDLGPGEFGPVYRFSLEGDRLQGDGSGLGFLGTVEIGRIEGNVTILAKDFYAPGPTGNGTCATTEETVPFKGELSPSGLEMTLRWIQTEWTPSGWVRAETMMGLDRCTGVVPKSQTQQELRLKKDSGP